MAGLRTRRHAPQEGLGRTNGRGRRVPSSEEEEGQVETTSKASAAYEFEIEDEEIDDFLVKLLDSTNPENKTLKSDFINDLNL